MGGAGLGGPWTPLSPAPNPAGRQAHVAVWTGSEMIIWGGYIAGAPTNTGLRYEARTDRWHETTLVDAPSPRFDVPGVWTGTELLIWGGYAGGTTFRGDGRRYDPVADVWTPITTNGAPTARSGFPPVWTGTEMIVWGGRPHSLSQSAPPGTGARYSPANNAWATMEDGLGPADRGDHCAVWTGTGMIVWGGTNYTRLASGAFYDPATDSWSATNPTGGPMPRAYHGCAWTGSEMIVWGGLGAGLGNYLADGMRYDHEGYLWRPLDTAGAPGARAVFSTLWTGGEMIVWGGETGADAYTSTGGRYDAVTQTWVPTPVEGAPSPRALHSAVWTGAEMIIFGGNNGALGGSRLRP
jgi:hypothetical protein